MKPKLPKQEAPKETREQRQQRRKAEGDNIRAIQGGLSTRTAMFNRIRMPRVSIATGRSSAASPLG